jgi:hypothetical protein
MLRGRLYKHLIPYCDVCDVQTGDTGRQRHPVFIVDAARDAGIHELYDPSGGVFYDNDYL